MERDKATAGRRPPARVLCPTPPIRHVEARREGQAAEGDQGRQKASILLLIWFGGRGSVELVLKGERRCVPQESIDELASSHEDNLKVDYDERNCHRSTAHCRTTSTRQPTCPMSSCSQVRKRRHKRWPWLVISTRLMVMKEDKCMID